MNFDVTDQKFLKAYFEYLHHPNEEEGVDFWWLDWQQGGLSKIPGLDPLWMLNHYHYLDSGRRGKRRLTFSRYAGMGSHRYPVGFSGDTIISWESLAFQPYFTANASNVGYGWWSHDIGGHMKGYRDEELSTRWIQFGVFSPIMRLHSSNSAFTGKEPWNYNAVSENIMKRYLKLRHEMIPYLYTMNYHASHDGQPLIRPMYYLEPEQPEAYEVPNEYYFGTELVVCPITEPTDKAAGTACVKAWIPEGKWYDIFSGLKYDGGRMLELYRSLEDIPVLAKEGAIIPLTDLTEYTNSVENPKELAVKIVPGKKNAFILMEDTGDTCEDKEENWAQTKLEWINENEFIIHPANGNLDVIPKRRTWKMEFYGIADVDTAQLMPFSNGSILPSTVKAVKKGESGAAGELRGDFDLTGDLGDLYANTSNGIFGILEADDYSPVLGDAVPVGRAQTGPAVIRSNVQGDTVEEFDIEIVSVTSTGSDGRDMVISVKDPDLISATGGIVQGMSGSPILQNGKLIGAVTHVFVMDSTKGYGIFAETMLEQLK